MTKRGRPFGAKQKPKKCVAEICEALGFNPFELLANVGKGDFKAIGYDSKTVDKVTKDGSVISEERITLDQRLKAAAQLAPHVAPTLKAIEHTGEVDLSIEIRRAKIEEIKARLKAKE
jgi:tellurite resistance protein